MRHYTFPWPRYFLRVTPRRVRRDRTELPMFVFFLMRIGRGADLILGTMSLSCGRIIRYVTAPRTGGGGGGPRRKSQQCQASNLTVIPIESMA